MKTRKMIMFTGAAIMAAGMMAGCRKQYKGDHSGPHNCGTHNSGRNHKGNCGRGEKTTRQQAQSYPDPFPCPAPLLWRSLETLWRRASWKNIRM